MSEKQLSNVPGMKPDDIVIIKKLGYGSLNKLRGKATKSNIDVKNQGVNTEMDLGEYMKWIMIYGVVKAPFFDNCRTNLDREVYIDDDKLSAETGQFLFQEIEKHNGFAGVDEVKKN